MQHIRKGWRTIYSTCAHHPHTVVVPLIILCVGISGFGLGRISGILQHREAVRVTVPDVPSQEDVKVHHGTFVASRNGKRYHYPWCSGAQRILSENKRWFDTQAAARAAGYTPARNCEGLSTK